MTHLIHRIRVFVYRIEDRRLDYLLLHRLQGAESSWGPVQGPIEFGEKLEGAIQREVHCRTGLARPLNLIDLGQPAHWLVGDEEVIEWNYGFRALTDPECNLRIEEPWDDYQWARYSEAFPNLALENDRAAITRLHTLLGAA